MLAFTARRLLQTIPLLLGATVVIFVLMRLIPGDPAAVYAGPNAPREALEAVRRQMGLDDPLPVQYLIWMKNVLQGDLGYSYLNRIAVTELLMQRIPATLQLTAAAMFLTVAIAIPAGVVAAVRVGRPLDWAITTISGVSLAIPNFWLGTLTILLFAQTLGWLPPGGRGDFGEDFWSALQHLLLPAAVLASATAATLTRMVRAAMLEAMYEDYVRTARAKGLREQRVLLRHVLRNAMVPVITMIGLQVGALLGGAVIIESIFAWPGIGRLILTALQQRDYMLVQGALLALIVVYVCVNLITDLTYGLLDPRIRLGSR